MDVYIDNMCLICSSCTFHVWQSRVRYNYRMSKQVCTRLKLSHEKNHWIDFNMFVWNLKAFLRYFTVKLAVELLGLGWPM